MRVDIEKLARFDFSRREMLKSTAAVFVLGAAIGTPKMSYAQEGAPARGVFDPNVFLKIGPDNSVTLLSKHLEMGQAATTGMATMVADELGADWPAMRVEHAPNNPSLYNNLLFGPVMATGGSTSMAESWDQMRQVGAAARMMFIEAAAAKWGVPAVGIKIEKGVVSDGTGRQTKLGELAGDAMRVPVPKTIAFKAARDWSLIGKSAPRLDSKAKTTGQAVFACDVKLPGMLVAMVRRPDLFGAKVASFDAAEAKKVEGVVDAVRIPAGVVVLAKDTWAAMRGRDALKVTWDTSGAEKRSTPEIWAEYRQLAQGQGVKALGRGDASAGLKGAARKIAAEFTLPYLAHAPMEPLDCTMEFRGDSAEIWSGCQLQSIDQFVAAQVLGLTPDKIKINTTLAGGSFGRRGNPMGDWIVELASIAKVTPGRAPVQVVWTREDDLRGGFYRPMALHRVEAGIDPQGQITGWRHRIVSQSIFMGTPFERMAVKEGIDASSVEGVVDSPYAIAAMDVDVNYPKSPVPVLWWRSVGHSHTGFVMETVVDELARAARKDPVEFRLALLRGKPRDQAVVKLAAGRAGWGQRMPKGRGRGFAYHFSFGTRVAMVADVTLQGAAVKVDRVVAAVDCGVAVNPDLVVAQVEGAIGFALPAVLRNRITLTQGVVDQRNFDDYEPTRMREMPKVEVHLVKNEERPSGIGEPGVPPLAPAVGNAVFAAGGKRLRNLPFGLTSA
jgi:isoquinoline 1-oxidoreductase subunit beta